jgi:hypothetical protein
MVTLPANNTDALREAVLDQIQALADDESLAHVATLISEWMRLTDNALAAHRASLECLQAALDRETSRV